MFRERCIILCVKLHETQQTTPGEIYQPPLEAERVVPSPPGTRALVTLKTNIMAETAVTMKNQCWKRENKKSCKSYVRIVFKKS